MSIAANSTAGSVNSASIPRALPSRARVSDALCALGKVPNQNNEAGCEKKLRLFTLKGRRLENMQVCRAG